MNKARLVVNTTVLFIAASIAEMTLHECGHFVAGLLLHMKPVLYHNYVSSESAGSTPGAGIWLPSAGPVLSLLIGILGLLILRGGSARGFTRLFLWYFSFSGFLGFFGYLMIAPFFSYGDTGYVLRALGCPLWAIILLALAGLVMLAFCVLWLAPFAVSLMSSLTAENKKDRGRFVFNVTVLTLIISIPLITLLNLPAPTFLSLLAPLMSPWSLLYAYDNYLRGRPFENKYDESEKVAGKMPIRWFILLAAMFVINRLLVGGSDSLIR